MPNPTRAEMAALVDLAKRLRELPIPDCVRAAGALEALMQERAEPVARQMPQPWNCPATGEICDRGCGAACERLSMVKRNPAPDASPPMVPSESRAFTIGAAPPAKPAGELPPLPEPDNHQAVITVSDGTGWVNSYSAEQMRAYALRAIREQQT